MFYCGIQLILLPTFSLIGQTLPVYGILIYFFCLQLQSVFCGIGLESKKSSISGHAKITDAKKPAGTIKWPFSDTDFQHPIQSPIDVITRSIRWKRLKKLTIHEPTLTGVNAIVYMSGTTVAIHIDGDHHDNLPYLMGGPIKEGEKFLFEQMHFHWGTADDWGSEHLINAEAFSVEIHMVHFNSKYPDFVDAATKDDGLAVLTIFVKVDSEDNELLKPLHDLLPEMKDSKVEHTIPWKDAMQWAISGMKINTQYYTYPGSLTTPPYSENVAFILLPKPISISHEQESLSCITAKFQLKRFSKYKCQYDCHKSPAGGAIRFRTMARNTPELKAFRALKYDEKDDHNKKHKTGPITHNNRKIQPRNHRPIFKGRIAVEL